MENYGEIIIYQTEDGLTKLEVKMENDTIWLTQAQLVELYQSSKANVSEHITHIFEEGELVKEAVVRKFRTTASENALVEAKSKKRSILAEKVCGDNICKALIFLTKCMSQ